MEIDSAVDQFLELLSSVGRKDLQYSEMARLSGDEEVRHSGCPGVYLLFSETQELLYIGESQQRDGLGNEVWRHVGSDLKWKYPVEGLPDPAFIRTIPLPGKKCFLAQALECFLIDKLDPPGNTRKVCTTDQPDNA